MKYQVLAATALLALSQVGLAQGDSKNTLAPARPVITHIDTAMAYEPGRMSIDGAQLGLVWQARIDGKVVPIVRNTGTRIVIEPGNMDPGFGQLELITPAGNLHGPIEFTPSIVAARHGNAVTIGLNPGEPCIYWLEYSFGGLATPNVVPGFYYKSFLDMSLTGGRSGLLKVGFATEPTAIRVNLPAQANLHLGGELQVQAYCMMGVDQYLCYTNMVKVPIGWPNTL